jgi:hypothetical protein
MNAKDYKWEADGSSQYLSKNGVAVGAVHPLEDVWEVSVFGLPVQVEDGVRAYDVYRTTAPTIDKAKELVASVHADIDGIVLLMDLIGSSDDPKPHRRELLRKKNKKTLFDLGHVTTTGGIMHMLMEDMNQARPLTEFIDQCLLNHSRGDWGNVCEEDAALNDNAVRDGSRVLSAWYMPAPTSKKIWIITEANRANTSILLPEEY